MTRGSGMMKCPRCGYDVPFPHHFVTKGTDEKSFYECSDCGKEWWRKYER